MYLRLPVQAWLCMETLDVGWILGKEAIDVTRRVSF